MLRVEKGDQTSQQTWTAFKLYFTSADKNRLSNKTLKDAGFHNTNGVTGTNTDSAVTEFSALMEAITAQTAKNQDNFNKMMKLFKASKMEIQEIIGRILDLGTHKYYTVGHTGLAIISPIKVKHVVIRRRVILIPLRRGINEEEVKSTTVRKNENKRLHLQYFQQVIKIINYLYNKLIQM